MKRCLLLLLLVISVTCDESLVPKTCTSKQQNANPFRTQLANQDKKLVLKTPETDTGACGVEWSTFGGCCNVKKLTAIAEADQRRITNAYFKISEEFEEFSIAYQQFYQNLNKLAVANESDWDAEGKRAIRLAQKVLLDESMLVIFDTMNDYVHKRSIKKYKKMMENCWEYNIKIRGSSLCSTCSGRGNTFFKGGKAIATESACIPIIKKCYRPLKATLRMLRVWRFLLTNRDTLENLRINFNGPTKLKDFKTLAFNIYEGGVANDIENIAFDFKQMVKDDYKHKGRFCDKFVKLQGTPYIVAIAERITEREPWILDFKPGIKKIVDQINEENDLQLQELRNKIKSIRAKIRGDDAPDNLEEAQPEEDRVLQIHSRFLEIIPTLETDPLFDSDAIWDKTKTQFGDASITKVGNNNPMNLTLVFP